MAPTKHLKYLRTRFCSKDYLENMILEKLASIESRTLKDLLRASNGVGKKVGVLVTYHLYLNGFNDINSEKYETFPTRSSS